MSYQPPTSSKNAPVKRAFDKIFDNVYTGPDFMSVMIAAAPALAVVVPVAAPVVPIVINTDDEEDEILVETALLKKYTMVDKKDMEPCEFVVDSQDEDGECVEVPKKHTKLQCSNVFDNILPDHVVPGMGQTQFLTIRDLARGEIPKASFTDTLAGFEMVSPIGVKVEVIEPVGGDCIMTKVVATNIKPLIKSVKLKPVARTFAPFDFYSIQVVGKIGLDGHVISGVVYEDTPYTAKFTYLKSIKEVMQVLHVLMSEVI